MVSPQSNQKVTFAKLIHRSKSPLSTRLHNKQRKVKFTTKSGSYIHRGSFSVSRRSGIPYSGEGARTESISSTSSSGLQHSTRLFSSSGKDSILSRNDSECKIVHAPNPITFVTKLESNKNVYGLQNSCSTMAKATFEMVVTGSKYFKGSVCSTNSVYGDSDDRCQSGWLGRSHEQSYSSGSLVKCAENVSHQLSRDGGSISDSETFFAISDQQECIDSDRQFHSDLLPEPSGRNKVIATVAFDMETLVSGSREQYLPQISSHSGQEKFSGRHVIETRVSPSDRVVNEQFSCEQDFSSLGLSNDGSVCNFSEQENTAVLFMDDSSESFCNRCNVNFLAEHVCLCIPTNSDDSQGVAAYETVPLQNNSDSTSLAETVLVSYSSKHVSGFSDKAATLGESAVTGKGENISPRPEISEFDGMAVVYRHFSAKGFSEETRKLLALSWRKGTRKDYTAKFKQFSMWCTERKVDPFLASLNDCADFLTSLFQRGLKYRTINGYRSMLSSFLPPIDNCPIGQHSYIIRLLKGVFNERPPVKRLIPNWDLSFILGCLKEDPFEPLKDASVKHLTRKTCFLVAITTFRRCSDLQSLQITDNDMNIGERGITFVRTGLSKQDRPNHESNHIFVPVFSQDKYLDPRRCLLRYIKKTKKLRKKDSQNVSKLFLATRKPHQAVTAQTISKWIVNLIKMCYKLNKKSLKDRKIQGHSTRSVGPSWALFKGASLKHIMESADWSSESIFIKHYLKPVNTSVLEV